MENIITNDIDFFLTSNKINFNKKILAKKFDEHDGDFTGGAILYIFTSQCGNTVYYLYIYETYVLLEYENNGYRGYPGPFTIDTIHGFWENMSNENKNLIFNLVLNNYNNPRKINDDET